MPGRYRTDIDGLRAIAVVSVLLFHVGFDSFGGGYVGVDVFFVISGFLITRLIRNEVLRTSGFSFSRFYVRRARRPVRDGPLVSEGALRVEAGTGGRWERPSARHNSRYDRLGTCVLT